MLDSITETVMYHLHFYGKFAQQQWAHISPVKYGMLLIGVGVFGWLLMKSSVKRC